MRCIFFSILFTISLATAEKAGAQNGEQEASLAVYNVGLGAFFSGIGAVINKPKHSNWRPYFIKGLWQGSIGGAINYAGKKSVYMVSKDITAYYLIARTLHYAGCSVISGAAQNKPFLNNWYFEYGPARFDFTIDGSEKLRVRFLPYFLYAGYAASQYHNQRNEYVKIDVGNSLLTGVWVFKGLGVLINSPHSDPIIGGVSLGHGMVYTEVGVDIHRIIAHEMVHTFQFSEYQLFNPWFTKRSEGLKHGKIKKVFRNNVYSDIPYFDLFYNTLGNIKAYNSKNYFEFEAHHFSGL